MKEINIYANIESWLKEVPDAVIRGTVSIKNDNTIEIQDENGYTQIINMSKLFAIVF
ncbi:MAG TPA: hypothetical protein VF941_13515 [Clostridia bacterium]